MSFTILYIEKTPLQPIKTKSSKSRKTHIFTEGLTHGFGLKMALFSTFFLCNISQENVFYFILEQKKNPFQAIKTRNSKSRKIDIFPKGLSHGFGLKMALFPTFIVYIIQARKMSFMIFQNEKTPFQGIKTRSSKSRNIDIFRKGLANGFCLKMALSSTFNVYVIQARKMSFTIFQNEKAPFQGIKTRSSKRRKIAFFQWG